MTLLEKCRELYPDGKLDREGLPTVCPWILAGLDVEKEECKCPESTCKECWSREYKEEVEPLDEDDGYSKYLRTWSKNDGYERK